MMEWTADAYGPDAWLVRFGRELSEDVMVRALSVARALERNPPARLREFTMGYASVLLEFDGTRPDAEPLLERLRVEAEGEEAPTGRRVEVPVVYNGPDLEEVARRTGLPREEVIQRHAGRSYRVWLLGFSPGFPYLGVLDERLQLPRRDTPRSRIAAGSVAIAGSQTGIYPAASAGGWHVIGHTPQRIFDTARPGDPFLLRPGDEVRFVSVEAENV